MLWADYLIIGIIAVSALIGVFRGFLREVISLVAWVLAFWVAYRFAPQVAPLLEGSIATPSLRLAAAYAGLFVLVLILGGVANFLIARMVSGSGLAGTDRALGAVFGVVRGIALAVLLVLLAGLTPAPADPWWKASPSIRLLEPYAVWLRNLMPPETAEHFVFSTDPARQAPAEPAPQE